MSRPSYDPELFEPLAELADDSFWFRARNRLIVSTLARHFPHAVSFLEVGCGSGVVLAALRESFPELELVGGELYEEGLEVARRRLPDVTLRKLDVLSLPYDGDFDVVGAFDVLEHLDDDQRALVELARAARLGGGVLVLVPQHPWLWSSYDELGEHRRRYRRSDLVDKARRAGLEIVEVTSFVSSLLPAMAVTRVLDRLRRTDPLAHLRPGRLNAVFERMLDGERKLIERGVSLPFGGSLLLVARKPRLP